MKVPDSVPPHPLRVQAALQEKGYEPEEWITQRQMADFWGVAYSTIFNKRFEGYEEEAVVLRKKKFYPAGVLTTYRSREVDKLEDKVLAQSLGHETLAKTEQVLPPSKRTQADYLQRLAKKVTLADWEDIVARAVADAKDGDRAARQWLSDHLIGTPIQRVAALISDVGSSRFTDDDRREAILSLITGETDERFTKPLRDDNIIDAEGDDSDS